MRIRLRIHTGPTAVAELAERIREAGLTVVAEGTETVYVDIDAPKGDSWAAERRFIAALIKKHGTTFGLRPHVN